MRVVRWMREHNRRPNAFHYTALIQACRHAGHPRCALDVFHDMNADGMHGTNHTYSALFAALGDCGNWREADVLYRAMPFAPDVQVRNALISALGDGGQWKRALEVKQELIDSGDVPTLVTFNTIIKAAWKARAHARVLMQLREEMRLLNLKPSVTTYTTLMQALSAVGENDEVWRCYQGLLKSGNVLDAKTIAVVITALCEAGKVAEAMQLFASQREGTLDKVTYCALIHGLASNHRFADADELFDSLAQQSGALDINAYNALIGARALPARGEKVLLRAKADNVQPNGSTYHTLVTNMCVHACLDDACATVLRVEGARAEGGPAILADTYNVLISYAWHFSPERAVALLTSKLAAGHVSLDEVETPEVLTLQLGCFTGGAACAMVVAWLNSSVKDKLRDVYRPPDLVIDIGDELRPAVLAGVPLREQLPLLLKGLRPGGRLDVTLGADHIRVSGVEVKAWLFGTSASSPTAAPSRRRSP